MKILKSNHLKITEHAIERIKTVLGELFDKNALDNLKSLNVDKFSQGKYYIKIHSFDKMQHIDTDNRNGDVLVAVINNGIVKTVMLTKSWRKDYFSDGKYIG